ncbi:hypothetical protein JXJ21_15720 [candidate division KSB1 bacterium]|nr:hypothetical protein [candidate division KSB1 bacterium]
MKVNFFMFVVLGAALVFVACGDRGPLSPGSDDIAQINQEPALGKKTPIVTPWESIETGCEVLDPGKQWVSDDGVLHVHGEVTRDIVESADPRIAGINTLTRYYTLNLATRNGTYKSKWRLEPLAVAGEWKGKLTGEFTGTATGYIFTGRGTGHGSGELASMEITVNIISLPEIQNPPCENALWQVAEHGEIIEKK